MSINRDEALSKVRKLMAMTTDRGCTEAEAAAAAGLAAKIMMAHDIEAAQIELEDSKPVDRGPIEIWDDPLDTTGGRLEKWKSRLAVAIAHRFGCEITHNYQGGLKIIGRAQNVQTVRYIYAYAAREIARLTHEKARGNGRVWVRNYRLGLIDAVRDAIMKEQESARREALEAARRSTNANALVLVQSALTKTDPVHEYNNVKSFLRSKGYRYTSTHSSAQSDYSAREAGRRDGANIYRGGGAARQLSAGRKELK